MGRGRSRVRSALGSVAQHEHHLMSTIDFTEEELAAVKALFREERETIQSPTYQVGGNGAIIAARRDIAHRRLAISRKVRRRMVEEGA